MSKATVNIDEAGARINELVKLVHRGLKAVITGESRPTARLVSAPPENGKHHFGKYRGKVKTAEDCNALLPDKFWFGKHL